MVVGMVKVIRADSFCLAGGFVGDFDARVMKVIVVRVRADDLGLAGGVVGHLGACLDVIVGVVMVMVVVVIMIIRAN